jgi:hypothetical protein
MFMIYLHLQLHMPVSNGSVVIATKLKAKYKFHREGILFFTLYKKITISEVAYFLKIITMTNLRTLHYVAPTS